MMFADTLPNFVDLVGEICGCPLRGIANFELQKTPSTRC